MNQYNNVNVILSNSQLNKLKLAIKNETAVTLRLLSDMIAESHDGTIFQVPKLRKAFDNNFSTDINYRKLKYLK